MRKINQKGLGKMQHDVINIVVFLAEEDRKTIMENTF